MNKNSLLIDDRVRYIVKKKKLAIAIVVEMPVLNSRDFYETIKLPALEQKRGRLYKIEKH